MKKQIMALILTAVLGTLSHAATTGQIDISGTVEAYHDISVTPVGGANIANLGSNTNAVKFASVTFSSNQSTGFKVTLTSANDGELVLDGGSVATNFEHVGYRVSLTNESGTIDAGITKPTLTDINLSSAQELAFTGSNLSPSNVTYDFNVTALAADTLKVGDYADTIDLEIADN